MRKKLRLFLSKNLFQPSWYAVAFNPYFIARRHLYVAIQKFARVYAQEKKVLDVGCGNKPYRDLFATQEYIGIDIAGGGHKDEAKQVDAYFDGKSIPFTNGQFDVVICTQVLEHSTEPEILLKEMYRVLAPQGVLYITVPFVWSEHEQPFDFRRYTSFGIRALCANAGFASVDVQFTTGIFGTLAQLLSAYVFERIGSRVWVRGLVTLVVCFPVQLVGLFCDKACRYSGVSLDVVALAKKQ